MDFDLSEEQRLLKESIDGLLTDSYDFDARKKYQKEMEGLDAPPYPGPKGQEVFEHVSKQAWLDWQSHQTMLINEKHLSLVDPAARKYLQGEMDKFFSGEEFDRAEGYVPPTK